MTGFDIIGGDSMRRPTLLGDAAGAGIGVGFGREATAEGSGFAKALSGMLDEASSLEHEAKNKADALARGESVEVHDLMIAMGKSEVAFNLMLEVRNKLVDAWQNLSRSVI